MGNVQVQDHIFLMQRELLVVIGWQTHFRNLAFEAVDVALDVFVKILFDGGGNHPE